MHNSINQTIKPHLPGSFERHLPRPFQHVGAIEALAWVDETQVVSSDRTGTMLLWRYGDGRWLPSTVLQPAGGPSCQSMCYAHRHLWCVGQGQLWGVCLDSGERVWLDVDGVHEMVLAGVVMVARGETWLKVWRWQEGQWHPENHLEHALYHEDPLEMAISPCGTLVVVNRYNQYARTHTHELSFWDIYDPEHIHHWQWRRHGRFDVQFADTRDHLWLCDLDYSQMICVHPSTQQEVQTLALPQSCDRYWLDGSSAFALGKTHALYVDLKTQQIERVALSQVNQLSTVWAFHQEVWCGGFDAGRVWAGLWGASVEVLSEDYTPPRLDVSAQHLFEGACCVAADHTGVWCAVNGQLWRWLREDASWQHMESYAQPELDRVHSVAVLGRFILLSLASGEQHLIERRTGECIARFGWPIERFVGCDERLWGLMHDGEHFALGHTLCMADPDLGLLTTIAPPEGVLGWFDVMTVAGDRLLLHAQMVDGTMGWCFEPALRRWTPFEHQGAVALSPLSHGFWSGSPDVFAQHVLWLDHRRTGWLIRDINAAGLPVVSHHQGMTPSKYNQRRHLYALAMHQSRRLVLAFDVLLGQLVVWNTQGVCMGCANMFDWFDEHTTVYFEEKGDRFLVHHPHRGLKLCALRLQ